MADFHPVLSVSVEEDLLPMSALLHQHGVVHRIFEEDGRQILTVKRQDQVEQVRALYHAWRAGKVDIELAPRSPSVATSGRAIDWRSAPVTLLLIALSILGFVLAYLLENVSWVSYLTFTPFRVDGQQLLFASMGGEYWRLVTPVFLHFGWLHIAFNCLWLWELGGRVEKVMGQVNMVLLFLVIAVVSNVSQFMFGGAGLFGGMSGVVYGLLGFSWVAPLLQPAWHIRPAGGVMLFMVGWLLACLVGLVEVLGFGAVANAAHIGGLVCGAVLGVLFGTLSRAGGDNTRA
jgi:GlpG protein